MKIKTRIGELYRQHPSWRELAAALDIDHVFLFKLYTGQKQNPSDATLKKLGLRKVVTYVRIES